MSLREKFQADYGEIAQEVHKFAVLPRVKARFRRFRRAYRRPTEGLFHKDADGEILLSDQYVWLGIVHDKCLPTFAINPEDARGEITAETCDVLLGIIAPLAEDFLDGAETRACLWGFLEGVKANLGKAGARPSADEKAAKGATARTKYVTAKEAIKGWHVARATLHRKRDTGDLKGHRPANAPPNASYRYDPADLDRLFTRKPPRA